MRSRISAAMALGAVLFLLTPATVAQAAPSLTPTLGGYVNAGDSAPFSFALADVTWDSAIVRIELADGTMTVDTAGLTLTLQPGSASFTGVSEIAFTGSLADVTTALADRLTWTAPATPADSYLRLTISVDSWVNGASLNSANGHYYMLSPVVLDWAPARDAAASLIHDGLQGYLTTVTSSTENAFVTVANGGVTSWIGATTEIAYVNPFRAPADQYSSNAQIAGIPHWGAGPEAGQQSTFTSWFSGEPNGTATDRCIVTNWVSPSAWNDGPCVGFANRSVVEFGGITASVAPLSFDNLAGPAPVRPAAPAGSGAQLAATGFGIAPLAVPAALAMLFGAALLIRSRSRLRAN